MDYGGMLGFEQENQTSEKQLLGVKSHKFQELMVLKSCLP